MTDALPGPRLLGAEIYRGSSYGGHHPLRVPRVPTVLDLTRALGWLPRSDYVPSPRAKPAALTVWHSADYIEALQQAEATQSVTPEAKVRHGLGTVSNPVFPEMYRRPATGAGGSLLAGEMLAAGGLLHHPGGGTHHGMPDRANGFCYLNDVVLALLSLRRNGVRRIAYVDIDAHHMDGVEHAFADDPNMLLISTHEERRWPFTGALQDRGIGQVFNLPLPRGLNDSEFGTAVHRLILPLLEDMAPDAIVLQCGADALQEDPLSRLALSNNAHADLVARLKPIAPRLLVLGGGGYNPWSVGRCWSLVWGVLRGTDIPERMPPEAQAVLRALSFPGNSRGRNPPQTWFTTLRDPPRNGPVRPEITDRIDTLRTRSDRLVPRALSQV